jgi:LysM repeat protein
MTRPQFRSMNMVFVMAVSAVFCAAATFIAILLLSNRPQVPAEDTAAGNGFNLSGTAPFATFPPAVDPGQQQVVVATEPPTPIPPTLTPQPPTRSPDPIIFIDPYYVQPNDSLYSIAEQQNSSIELMALWGISAEDLMPGQPIRLPVANPAYCPGSRAYVVRDKDTAFRIAVQFNTTADILRQMNGLDENYRIQVTQVICVPAG